MSKEAMKLALDHLINLQPILGNGLLEERQLAFIDPHIDCAITALQEGLAEQPAQQKPVAAAKKDAVFDAAIELVGTLTGMKPPPIETAPPEIFKPFRDFTEKVCSIFAAPQPAQRKPLTDEQIEALAKALEAQGDTLRHFARAIEAAHGIGVEK